ncbi:MAG: signal peptidase I [Patescibacteria group bacterium]|nr:signal peptidase I [Patescibacteria group bacterium]
MKLFKKIFNYIYIVIVLVIVTLAIATAFSVIEAPGGMRVFVVQSGSMEPSIKTGSLVLVAAQDEYQKDDVITFKRDLKVSLKDANSTATHRVIEVKDDEGRATFTTKGDANNTPDSEDVEIARVLGKVLLSVPLLGKIVAFTKTQTGFIALIVIPATILIYSEINSIKNEVIKLIKKKKKIKDRPKEKQDED